MSCVDLCVSFHFLFYFIHLANSNPGHLSLSNNALAESAFATSWRATKDDHEKASLRMRGTCPADAAHVTQHSSGPLWPFLGSVLSTPAPYFCTCPLLPAT